ncbi:MAG: SusD/RagB family nutrient-binding outer membrane lipoprotein [Chitinophagaceae bacterium]|nr:SusD/RagB family nutrient-binding outer membrane lipoprotein [Chitinophagaceae bacterium]
MKTHILNYIAIVSIAGILLTSCKKNFGDLNTNPNAPSIPSTKLLFGNAITNISGIHSADALLYTQYMSEFIYTQESRYFNKIYNYDPIYAGPLMDLQTIINLNTNPESKDKKFVTDNGTNNNQIGHARILKAFLMLHITDRWGAVPYTEALNGTGNTKPKFDTQKFIYNDLLKELKEAALQIDAGLPNDPLFDGNFNKWKTWANSLRAIIALRMIKTEDVSIAKVAFTEAVTAGIISSNSDNAIFKYLPNANYECPWYTNYTRNGRYDYGVSKTLIDKVVAIDDPRLPVFARRAINTATYEGVPYGENAYYDLTDYSLLGRAIYAQNAPLQITTYAQMCFTMAEAALQGWIPGGDAEVSSWYNKGIDASMDQWSAVSTNPVVVITAAQKLTYRSQASVVINPVNTLTLDQKLERIQTQKWLNFYMNNGHEAWAEWRRTGYPILLPASNPLNADGQIPRRQCYPQTEKDLNGANYAAIIAQQGADELSTRLWWDRP